MRFLEDDHRQRSQRITEETESKKNINAALFTTTQRSQRITVETEVEDRAEECSVCKFIIHNIKIL